MKDNIEYWIWYFLTGIFILEGMGVLGGRGISFVVSMACPALIVFFFHKKIHLHLPRTFRIGAIIMICLLTISTILSVNMQLAIENQIFIMSMFILFIFSNSLDKKTLTKYIYMFVNLATAIALILLVFFQFFLPASWIGIIPFHSYQYVYKMQGVLGHHPIGAFVLIPLTLWTWLLFNGRARYLFAVIPLFVILILSGLRSAILAYSVMFLIMIVLKRKEFIKKRLLVFLSILIFLISAYSLVIFSNINNPLPLTKELSKLYYSIYPEGTYRSVLNGRNEYWSQAYQAVREKSLFGYGLSNYIYPSMLFSKTSVLATSNAHSLFINIAVENGIIVFFIALFITIFLLWNGRWIFKTDSVEERGFYILFLGLLIFFSLNFYYKSYFYAVFTTIIAGIIYKNNNDKMGRGWSLIIYLISGLLIVGTTMIFMARLFLVLGYPDLALMIYPPMNDAHKMKIFNLEIGSEKQLAAMENYYRYVSGDQYGVLFLANTYNNANQADTAIKLYKRALMLFPSDPYTLVDLYGAMEKYKGKDEAANYLKDYVSKNKWSFRLSTLDGEWFASWCKSSGVDCFSVKKIMDKLKLSDIR